MSEINFNLGDKISVNSILVRKKTPHEYSYRTKNCRWMENNVPEKECIIVGIRTLTNGTAQHDPEVGYQYEGTESFQALLVADNIHRKPFYVKIPGTKLP